ncbi:Zn-dependent hydrolase, partial [Escherichia coli]|nr:Zn-dependent hydrolase [Escherichia coli]
MRRTRVTSSPTKRAETLPWLSSFGADPTGGMTRLLYSPEWLATHQQFKKRMAASGL